MQQYKICDKNCVKFYIKLAADISIWMQSRHDEYDFSATLAKIMLCKLGHSYSRRQNIDSLT